MVTGIVVLVIVIAVVLFTSLFKTVNMGVKTRTLIATILSVIGGAVADLASKGFDVSQYASLDILATALAIYGGSQLIYNFIMRGTDAGSSLDAKLTSIGSDKVPADDADGGGF